MCFKRSHAIKPLPTNSAKPIALQDASVLQTLTRDQASSYLIHGSQITFREEASNAHTRSSFFLLSLLANFI